MLRQNTILSFCSLFLSYSAFAVDFQQSPHQSELPKLCKEAGDASAIAEGFDPQQIDRLSTEQLEETFENMYSYRGYSVFNSNNVRTVEWVARKLLNISAQYLDSSVPTNLTQINTSLDVLEKYFENAQSHPEQVVLPSEAQMLAGAHRMSQWDRYYQAIPQLCKYLFLPECKSVFNALLNTAVPYQAAGENASFYNYMEYMSTRSFIPGIARYSLDTIAKLRLSLNHSNTPLPVSDIWADVTLAFKKTGFTDSEATYAAMAMLGAYSIEGAAYIDLAYARAYPSFGLFVLLSAVSYFDRLQLSHGERSYFIPKKLKVNCSYGKPYHFWMAAHLAYRLRLAGYSARSSATAVTVLGLGYQTVGRGARDGGGYGMEFFNFPEYDPRVNLERLDIFYDSLGAYFGSEYEEKSGARNFNHLLHTQFTAADRIPKRWIDQLTSKMSDQNEVYAIKWFNRIAPYTLIPGFNFKALAP